MFGCSNVRTVLGQTASQTFGSPNILAWSQQSNIRTSERADRPVSTGGQSASQTFGHMNVLAWSQGWSSKVWTVLCLYADRPPEGQPVWLVVSTSHISQGCVIQGGLDFYRNPFVNRLVERYIFSGLYIWKLRPIEGIPNPMKTIALLFILSNPSPFCDTLGV